MSVKALIICMQRDEGKLLKTWFDYHRLIFLDPCIVVLDNGSKDEITLSTLEYIKNENGMVLSFPSKKQYERKGELVLEIERQLASTIKHDVLFPLDCDEFIAAEIDGKLNFNSYDINKIILNELPLSDSFYIKGSYINNLSNKNMYRFWPEDKIFSKADSLNYIDQGFHTAISKSGLISKESKLIHLHFQMKPYLLAKEHAINKLTGRVNINSLVDLKVYDGPGFHLVPLLIENEDFYIKNIEFFNFIDIPEVVVFFAENSLDLPY